MSDAAERVPLLSARGVVKRFDVRGGVFGRAVGSVQAVDRVDLDIYPGEVVGLVGESGCGKSTLGRVLLGLLPADEGTVTFGGRDVVGARGADLRALRREMQLVFQDPFSSLDPRATVGDSIAEGLRAHGVPAARRRQRVQEVLDLVGLESYHARRYPHQFSGGQRQRIGIARALAVEPRFLVADEPVSALDVSIQSQILNLLRDLQSRLDFTLMFVAHDLAVVEHLCDRVAVMYLGQIAEIGTRDRVFGTPEHPYTEALLSAIPVADPEAPRIRHPLKGELPSLLDPPSGCRFHTRCPIAVEGVCDAEEPHLAPAPLDPAHLASCHLRTGDHQDLDRGARSAGARRAPLA
ncbi:MAG TPA: ABC transporter ATP-binding protein [Acidimicrobiales bacterium]|nr:ABC transporter ATP-binding protein [Acidimicrobiales bacterium]